jgi:glucose-1-phosphate thymidylyltransferase
MKGVILAGGTGSRLHPITRVMNKHVLPVGEKPMIFHPIERMIEAGIEDIMIISGTSHMDAIFNLLGSGSDFGCTFTYKVQDKPNGIGGALLLCENFVGDDSCLVILGDNIFTCNLSEHVSEYESNVKSGCIVFLREVDDPHRYGVATLDEKNYLVKITEKPKEPDSNLCITGVYIYDSEVFDIIKKTKPSQRGEIEITDINNEYIKRKKSKFFLLDGMWTDAGTWESYKIANDFFHHKSGDKIGK